MQNLASQTRTLAMKGRNRPKMSYGGVSVGYGTVEPETGVEVELYKWYSCLAVPRVYSHINDTE